MPVWASATCFTSPWAHRQPAYRPLHGNTAGCDVHIPTVPATWIALTQCLRALQLLLVIEAADRLGSLISRGNVAWKTKVKNCSECDPCNATPHLRTQSIV
jgi:hypothetical protein